jgi:peroxiredoxin Q/BCP
MAKKAELGKKVPAFKFETTSGKAKLSDLKGKNVVLYFYPKDSTPGCTTEGHDFNNAKAKFSRKNTVILGVSKDSLISHEKFIGKQGYKFDLISDESGEICELFDVIKEKNMYGRKFMGIERSTFLIDESGKLVNEWRKVKVKGHVDEVLAAVKEL